MFRRLLSCISQLWDVLCESMASTTSQIPSSAALDSVASTTSQIPSSVALESVPSTSSQTLSALYSRPTSWDVFLSFRGEDTRYKFTSHLYSALDSHGVRTFMDDPELRSGEVISDALLQAIHESKTYVLVLSEKYASSSWCLDELVEILKCHKRMKRLVIPVFYNILASVVRHQTDSFKQAFEKHETRFVGEKEKVNNWRLALKNVAAFSGKYVSAKRSESDIINDIVDEILHRINPKALIVTKYPVGLDSRVKDITTLLSSDTEGVIKYGIFGMGGVGKTTLAKAVYNQLLLGGNFKGSCFLANVREVTGTFKGLGSLQQKLINDVLKCKKEVKVDNVEEGTKLIRDRICSAKILVLIDDVDQLKQYESLVGAFASGSVVIITTRDEETLDRIKVQPKHRYRLKELDDAEALELFTQHAFQNDKPDDTLVVLSKDILGLAGGLPLALEIFGSYLSTQSEVGWKSYIEKLQRDPDSTIQQKLIISLTALELEDRMLKKIFLDIACFFTGRKKDNVVEILETYYSYAGHKIDILNKRCLLTINNGDELMMHDLLRDMGREVARNNSRDDEPGKHSRLWLSKDIHDVLKNHKGTEAIECIIIEDKWDHSGTLEAFKRMSKLRFLDLYWLNFTGSFEQPLEDLRWLCWFSCPLKCLPSDFCPQNLVTLELVCSSMRTMWEPNMVSHVFEKLKTLDMSHSLDLTTTPDFTKLPFLETLNLEGCESLEEVHMSIGRLVRLVFLKLGGCVNLRSLPDSICNLRVLEVLEISDCSSLEALPTALGNIESLKELNAEKLVVSKLPDSIRRLRYIVKLRLNGNKNLGIIPDTICNLKALEVLDISDCSSLEALPTALGNIESLKELNANNLVVSKLPDSIGRLSKLVKLGLNGNKSLEIIPDTICNLKALEVLDISDCSSLEALPTELGNIESLKLLDANKLVVSKLPDSIGRLSKLVKLGLSDNKNLETLPDTICNLGSLEILDICYCEKLEILPDELWTLTRLRKLNAHGDILLKRLPEIESSQIALSLQELDLYSSGLTSLPSGFNQLSNLQSLNIAFCVDLLSIEELPPNLELMWADGCKSMKRIPNLSNLKQLEILGLTDCIGLTEIMGLEELTSLRQLNLRGCSVPTVFLQPYTQRFFQVSPVFEQLCALDMSFCEYITMTPDFSKLPYLQYINLNGCKSLEEVHTSIGSLLWFKSLYLCGCGSLRSLPDSICNLTSLEILDISKCKKLEILPDQLWKLTRLRELDADGDTLLRKLPDIDSSQIELSLKKLNLSESSLTTLPSGISQLLKLKHLDLRDCRHLLSIEELPSNLKWINAYGCTSIERLPNLSNLKKLKELYLPNSSGFTEIQGLEELTSLKQLGLEGCSPTLLAYIFTQRFFQVLFGFGHTIDINVFSEEFPDWINQSSEYGSTMSLYLPPNVSHDLLGMILCFKHSGDFDLIDYSVENTTSGFILQGSFYNDNHEALMVIVPTSIFSVRDGDDRIELIAENADILGIHLLYKQEITTIDGYDSVNVTPL